MSHRITVTARLTTAQIATAVSQTKPDRQDTPSAGISEEGGGYRIWCKPSQEETDINGTPWYEFRVNQDGVVIANGDEQFLNELFDYWLRVPYMPA